MKYKNLPKNELFVKNERCYKTDDVASKIVDKFLNDFIVIFGIQINILKRLNFAVFGIHT